MLVLTKKSRESVVVGHSTSGAPMLTITVLEMNRGKVRLGFNDDSSVPVHRLEVWERIRTDVPTSGSAAPVR